MEFENREIKRAIKNLKKTVETIDTEDARRLENVDKDLVYLRKEFKYAVKRSKTIVIGLMAELEIKVDKLALEVVKVEVAVKPGSLPHPKEKIN